MTNPLPNLPGDSLDEGSVDHLLQCAVCTVYPSVATQVWRGVQLQPGRRRAGRCQDCQVPGPSTVMLTMTIRFRFPRQLLYRVNILINKGMASLVRVVNVLMCSLSLLDLPAVELSSAAVCSHVLFSPLQPTEFCVTLSKFPT